MGEEDGACDWPNSLATKSAGKGVTVVLGGLRFDPRPSGALAMGALGLWYDICADRFVGLWLTNGNWSLSELYAVETYTHQQIAVTKGPQWGALRVDLVRVQRNEMIM